MGQTRTRKQTVREFIDERSYGAFVTFEFDIDKETPTRFKDFNCISVDDFLTQYGRRSSFILDDYVVIDTRESYPSQDQGQTIVMTTQKKSEYAKTLKPVKLTPFDADDIIGKLEDMQAVKDNVRKYFSVFDENFSGLVKDLQPLDYLNYVIRKLKDNYE